MSDEEKPWNESLGWLKAAKGLEYLQEGLEDFVENGVNRHHVDLLKRTGVTKSNACNDCTIENILPEHPDGTCTQQKKTKCLCTKNRRNRRLCPAGICSKIYDCIVCDHCFKSPLWDNTDPRKWCSNSWSIAKVYQTTIGPNSSAKNTDASGLLSIIINDITFADQLNNPVEGDTDQTNNIYCKARKARNDILHSSKMKIDRVTLFEYIDLFSEVLKDIKDLLFEDKAKKAFDALQTLKTADTNITREEEKKIKLQRKNALQDIELEKQNALTEIKAATQKAKEDIAEEHVIYERITSNTTREERYSNDYERRISELRMDLISFNRQHYSTIPISPLFETEAANLIEFYVIPELKYVDVHGQLADIIYQRERDNIVLSLNDIFHTKRSSNVNEIYMIADAGFGKTAFCKFLAVSWCHAYDPIQEESVFFDSKQEVLETMREFTLLFFISLRNADDKDVHIDDLIEKQICNGLARRDSYPRKFIQRILTEERSLIILDGLDEWGSPSQEVSLIPNRSSRPKCTIFTTTRTWKFSTLQLGPKDIQKKVLLSGINGSSRKELAEKVLQDTAYNEFRQQIESRFLEDLAQIPLMLMILICLWIEKKSLRDTICQIYSNILDVLIFRSKQRRVLETRPTSTEDNTFPQNPLSMFYSENEYCREYKHYMESLAGLAAETLFSKSKHNSLVFDEQVTLSHLSNDCLTFSLAIGVLTKIEVPMKLLSKSPPKFSFLHKTFQEFFAALNVCLTQEFPSICDSLESILDLSNVFIFTSGLSKNIIRKGLLYIKDIVLKDPIITKYRKEALSSDFVRHTRKLMMKHQEMHIACMKELHSLEQIYFTIEDLIIMETYTNPRNIPFLKTLLKSSIVKSLTIDNQKSMGNISDIMENFNLDQINSLERLDYWGISDDGDFSKIMSNSENTIKCITLHFNKNSEEGIHTLLSTGTLSHMESMQRLESLSLWYVTLRHFDLEELLAVVSQRSNMSYIGLQDVQCVDGESCEGFSFNLSRHDKLEVLNIGHIPLKELQINTTSLKECRLVEFPFKGVLNSVLECLPDAKTLKIFVCHFLTDACEISDVMQMLPNLQTLKSLRFYGMNIETPGLESILPSSLREMELLQLFRVTLSCTALKETINMIRTLPQMVEIELLGCSVNPNDELGQLLEDIKQSKDLEFLTNNSEKNEYDIIRKLPSRC